MYCKYTTVTFELFFPFSVTEHEIHQGLDLSKYPDTQVLCYIRHFTNIETNIDDKSAGMFVDIINVDDTVTIDREAEALRKKLHQCVLAKLNINNVKRYDTTWRGKAIEECLCEEHSSYLNTFCTDFIADMKRLIDGSNLTGKHIQTCCQEVLHHASFAQRKCELFHGRTKEVSAIKEYLINCNDSSSPLIVTSQSGYGKTALLAHVASQIHAWFNDKCVLILRLMGTSPQSSDILNTFKSIVDQICFIYGCKPVYTDKQIVTPGERKRFFSQLLGTVSKSKKNLPLIIVLDAVDQLHDNFDAFNMSWLPRKLPENVFMIVSMLSNRYRCLENTKKRISDPHKYIEIKHLSQQSADEVIKSFLSSQNRCLTQDQTDLVRKSFSTSKQPLLLKLLLDNAKLWNSYTQVEDITLLPSVCDAIKKLFSNLEIKYGKVFISNTLGYITCSPGGLSNIEMEDVLSCDNSVLSEVYQYHDPPLEDIIRIPSLMWSRLQYALREYLATRQVDDKTVVTWYHRLFWETAEEVYLYSQVRRKVLHSALADLFLQEDGIQKTVSLRQRDKIMINVDRCVQPQHLISRNKRKLNILPYHLYQAGRNEELKSHCLVNFKWLYTTLKAFESVDIAKDYKTWFEKDEFKYDHEVELINKLLSINTMLLWRAPNTFAFHVVDKLCSFTEGYPMLGQMVSDAVQWTKISKYPQLVPTHPIYCQGIDGPITFESVIGGDVIICDNETTIVCLWSENYAEGSWLMFLELGSMNIVECVNVDFINNICVNRNKNMVAISGPECLKVYETKSGDQIHYFKSSLLKKPFCHIIVDALALSTNGKYCASVYCCEYEVQKRPKHRNQHILHIVDMEQVKVCFSTTLETSEQDVVMHFVCNDTKLLICDSTGYSLYSVTESQLISKTAIAGELLTHLSELLSEPDMLVGVVLSKNTFHMIWVTCESGNFDTLAHIETSNSMVPFGLQCKSDGTMCVIGLCCFKGGPETSAICLIDRDDKNPHVYITVPSEKGKQASCLLILPDWTYGVVGWNNGDITIISIAQQQTVYCVSLVEQNLKQMILNTRLNEIYTISTRNDFKIWDVDSLICLAEQKRNNNLLENPDEEYPHCIRCLDGRVECGSMAVLDDCIITANDSQEPIFYKLNTGSRHSKRTSQFHTICTQTAFSKLLSKSRSKQKPPFIITSLENEVLAFQTSLHDGKVVCITQGYDEPRVVSQKHFSGGCTWCITTVPATDDDASGRQSQLAVMTSDGTLAVYNIPYLHQKFRLSIPDINQALYNTKSHEHVVKDTKCNCLHHVEMYATFDGTYCLILYPAHNQTTSGMAVDLVDLEHNVYIKRCNVSCSIPWKLSQINACFLMLTSMSSDELQILLPSELKKARHANVTYCGLIQTGNPISHDGMLGIELIKKSSQEYLQIWNTNTLELTQELSGDFSTFDLISADISSNHKYIVTTNYQGQITVLSIATGEALCRFGTPSVDKVFFNPSCTHVVVQAWNGPKQTCLIFKLVHLDSC